jgi:Protein of unknown function (DUF3768)
MAWFRNHYSCPRCGKEWSEEWQTKAPDDCPRCGAPHVLPRQSVEISAPVQEARARKIAGLNDHFRRTFEGGEVIMTATVDALPDGMRARAVTAMVTFDTFTKDNDPYGEHDFGSFEVSGRKFFWKIDYYNASCLCAAEDPANPEKTTRVLTLMLAEDY